MVRMTIAMLGLITALSTAAPLQTPAGTPPPVVLFETPKGNFEIQFFPEDAPKSVEKILGLVKQSFYRGQRVHRVTASLVQFGDLQSRDMSKIEYWGNGGSGSIVGVAEISKKHPHTRGAVGLAHSGDPVAADSQLYIMKQPSSGLDGKHAVIGRVIKGMDAVDRLEKTDLLKNVSIKAATPK
jgi:peptidyl-prolyl cis-trans isomerase B (cyclophilin B)